MALMLVSPLYIFSITLFRKVRHSLTSLGNKSDYKNNVAIQMAKKQNSIIRLQFLYIIFIYNFIMEKRYIILKKY